MPPPPAAPVAALPASVRIGGRDFALARGPYLVGVINLSPESPIKEAVVTDAAGAVERARAMAALGASIVDLGARSSLFSAPPVSGAEERRRLLPAVAALKQAGFVVSVDTWDAATARAAAREGADLINDSEGLQDPAMIAAVAESGLPVVVPFLNGPNPREIVPMGPGDPVPAVMAWFAAAAARARAAGITQVILDPGTGYAQPAISWEDKEIWQRRIYPHLPRLRAMGFPVFVAPPWKPPDDLLPDLARIVRETELDFLRAHNVAIAAQAVRRAQDQAPRQA